MLRTGSSSSLWKPDFGKDMKNPIDTLFLAHPRSVGETYIQHLRFALRISAQLLMAAGGAVIHALVPRLFENTASNRIRALYEMVRPRDS